MSHEQTDSLDGTLSQSIRNTDSHAQLKTKLQRNAEFWPSWSIICKSMDTKRSRGSFFKADVAPSLFVHLLPANITV